MHKTIPLVTALLLGAVSPTFGMIAKDENTIVIGDGDVTTKILPLRVVSLTDRLIQVPGGKEQVNLVLENCLKNDFSGIKDVVFNRLGELHADFLNQDQNIQKQRIGKEAREWYSFGLTTIQYSLSYCDQISTLTTAISQTSLALENAQKALALPEKEKLDEGAVLEIPVVKTVDELIMDLQTLEERKVALETLWSHLCAPYYDYMIAPVGSFLRKVYRYSQTGSVCRSGINDVAIYEKITPMMQANALQVLEDPRESQWKKDFKDMLKKPSVVQEDFVSPEVFASAEVIGGVVSSDLGLSIPLGGAPEAPQSAQREEVAAMSLATFLGEGPEDQSNGNSSLSSPPPPRKIPPLRRQEKSRFPCLHRPPPLLR